MVEADGSGGDETHATSFQQAAVATGAGADDQGIGIPDKFRGEVFAGDIGHFIGQRVQSLFDEGYFIVNNYFHVYSLF